jgi:hypothetical protein
MHSNTALATHAPLAALLVLVEIAVGTSILSHVIDWLGRIGRGFVGTTALISAVVAGIAWLIAANLGTPEAIVPGLQSADLGAVQQWMGIALLAMVTDAFFCAVGTDRARQVVGIAVMVVGAVAVATCVRFAAGVAGPGPAMLVILPGVALSGAAWAGMLLGHWYLINPAMSFKPLRQAVYIVFGSVAAEVAGLSVALVAGGTAATSRLISGDQAFLFWALVVGSGVVFTSAVNALTYYFARIRANQPATAMLYVLIISVMMGMVPAQLIFLQTGVGA